MITVDKMIEKLQELSNKGYGELPVVYAEMDEGCTTHHKVEHEPCEFKVNNIDQDYYLEKDENDNIPNCILIN